MMLADPTFELITLVQGFPGRSLCHGGLGWSTISFVRMGDRRIIIDAGSFNARKSIYAGLKQLGLQPSDITDVLLTHAHYDHALNWVLFPKARIHIGAVELEWAAAQEPGDHVIPELYIQALNTSPQLAVIGDRDWVLPGIKAARCPGHTPGSLVFRLEGERHSVLFTGDAAKNRAELLSRSAHMVMDEDAMHRSMEAIWTLWQERPGTLLVPGHDLPMKLEDGRPNYIGTRQAGVSAWFGDELEQTTIFNFARDADGRQSHSD